MRAFIRCCARPKQLCSVRLAAPRVTATTRFPVKTSDWIMVVAILCGPILAVQAQKWIEVLRENKNRRLWTFKRLMATRGATVSPGHVEALNTIDLEFNGRRQKDQQVRRRWKEYLDHLGSLPTDPEQQQQQLPLWLQRNDDLLADLLHDMGVAVGYDFDKVQIRKGIYSPIGHANIEFEFQAIRRLLIELLAGNRSLPMDVRSLPQMQPPEDKTKGAIENSGESQGKESPSPTSPRT
jgi:hypothetical protein